MLELDLLTDVALDGFPVGWFSPTYKMLSDSWNYANKVLKPVIDKPNVQEKQLRLITGGVIDFWSLDNPDGPRGRKYKRVAVDEAAMIAKLQAAWQEVIRPTLTDYEGDAWFGSTPKGATFFKTIFNYGQDPLKSEWASWQLPTSSNPHIKLGEIEAARQDLPGRVFAQEYLAEFLQGGGEVFRDVARIATEKRKEPYKGNFVAGLDWGQSNDFTVISVFDTETRKQVDLDRFNQVGWAVQRARVHTMREKWGISKFLAEANSIGGPNIEALALENIPIEAFTTTAQSKPPLIESWALAFERGETAILDDPVMISEHSAYERTTSLVTGRATYSAPDGMHDDTVIASALAWKAMLDGGPRVRWL